MMLLSILSLWSCKKDFPEPTDPYKSISLEVSEKWHYKYPEGQHVVWIEATDKDVLYITQSKENTKLLHLYRFSLDGGLLNDFDFEVQFVDFDLSESGQNTFFNRKDNWLSIGEIWLSHYFIHIQTGQNYHSQSSFNIPQLEPFDLYLSRESVVIYQQYRDNETNDVFICNLDTDERKVMDTLPTQNKKYKIIGELPRLSGHTLLGSFRPIYLVSPIFQRVGQSFDLVGLSFNQNSFSIEKWSSDNVFRSLEELSYAKGNISEKDIFVTLGREVYCIDVATQSFKWKQIFPKSSWVRGKAFSNSSKAFYHVDNRVEAVNLSSGTHLWSVAADRFNKPILATENYLIMVNFHKINKDELFGDEIKHLDIYDVIQGRLLYSKPNIIGSTGEKVNDLSSGLGLSLAIRENTLFIADHQQFAAVMIEKKQES